MARTAPLQTRADLLQQQVAEVMAEGVVDLLEAVEVEQQQRQRRVLASSGEDRLRQPVLQQGAIGQARQPVVQRLVTQGLLGLLALGDVARHHDQAPISLCRVSLMETSRSMLVPSWWRPSHSWTALTIESAVQILSNHVVAVCCCAASGAARCPMEC